MIDETIEMTSASDVFPLNEEPIPQMQTGIRYAELRERLRWVAMERQAR